MLKNYLRSWMASMAGLCLLVASPVVWGQSSPSPEMQLWAAVAAGDFRQTERLINRGVDVNFRLTDQTGAVGRELKLFSNGEHHEAEDGDPVVRIDTPLKLAVSKGHSRITERLLIAGAVDRDRGALRLALEEGSRQLLLTLLQAQLGKSASRERNRGVEETASACAARPACTEYLSDPYADGQSPLLIAFKGGGEKLQRVLFAAGAEVKEEQQERLQFFISSVADGNLDGVRRSLQSGWEINPNENVRSDDGFVTALLVAVYRGKADIVRLLLENDADPNQSGETADGVVTPLFVAAHNDHEDIVDVLLEYDADPDQRGSIANGVVTPLFVATHKDARSMVRLLLENDADPNQTGDVDGSMAAPLFVASFKGLTEIARLLIDNGADPNQKGEAGGSNTTPLFIAASNGHEEIVRLLLKRGADPNEGGSYGEGYATPLFIAANLNSERIVRLLLEHGADPDERGEIDTGFVTPLFIAANNDLERIVELLLKYGASPDLSLVAKWASDPEGGQGQSLGNELAGASPLILAAAAGNEGVVRLLIEAGSDVNRIISNQDYPTNSRTSGASALILASANGHRNVVRLLIDAGAQVNYRIPGERLGRNPNTRGATALVMARNNGHTRIASMLKNAGAEE